MILSFIGQPDLRLGLQLVTTAATVIRAMRIKNTFFIIWLWG